MHIREALPGDAEAMSRVFIASITKLCEADHRGDPAVIGHWIANKSPDQLLAHMEAAMRDRGVREARLLSTGTAHRFYFSAGWQDAGKAPPAFPGVGAA